MLVTALSRVECQYPSHEKISQEWCHVMAEFVGSVRFTTLTSAQSLKFR